MMYAGIKMGRKYIGKDKGYEWSIPYLPLTESNFRSYWRWEAKSAGPRTGYVMWQRPREG